MNIEKTLSAITATDKKLENDAQKKIDLKTKPLGSLGVLEAIAQKMALIQNNLTPSVKSKSLLVFAGDHGVSMEGVSAFPAEVTPQMVLNFLNGGAAINVLCRHNGIHINVVDMGVNYDFENTSNVLMHKKVRKGTRNFLKEDAMTENEAIAAIENGMDAFSEAFKQHKPDIIGVGEMGIGNTTSATAIICAATGLSPDSATGRGTGIDNERLIKKISVIKKALEERKPDRSNGLDILKKVGGFEIAGIAGAVLAASASKIPVVLDGLISTAGGLIAYLIKPEVKDYLFSGHKSVEAAQKAALDRMGLTPIIDLNMRLGEGTGAAIAIDIIDASCKILCEMASFEEAGVSGKE